jgi:hypothetical protein
VDGACSSTGGDEEMSTKFYSENLEGREPLERKSRRWEDSIKIDFR